MFLAFFFTFLIWFAADLYMPIFWSSIAEAVDYGHRKTGTRGFGPGLRRHFLFARNSAWASQAVYWVRCTELL